MRYFILMGLFLASCERPQTMSTYSGANFSCQYPKSWKVVAYHDDPGRASVEFDFPGPGFATIAVFKPDNKLAFENYTRIASGKFPVIHEESNPEQKVTTLETCVDAKLGGLSALRTSYSVLIPPGKRECTFTYVDLTKDDFVALIDIFDEGTPLSEASTTALETFILSIDSRRLQSRPPNGTGAVTGGR